MNTIPDHTMRLMIAATSAAIAAMSSVPASDRPNDQYSQAIGRLDWMYERLLQVAVAPVAVETVPDLETV